MNIEGQAFHSVRIGRCGESDLAIVMREPGGLVTGSDLKEAHLRRITATKMYFGLDQASVSSDLTVDATLEARRRNQVLAERLESLSARLNEETRLRDLIVVVGAGDISKFADILARHGE